MLLAFGAYAPKQDVVILGDITGRLFNLIVNLYRVIHVYIAKNAAPRAPDMVMARRVAVKPIGGIGDGNAHDISRFGQYRQVAVNGSQTDFWIGSDNITVNLVGGGMK